MRRVLPLLAVLLVLPACAGSRTGALWSESTQDYQLMSAFAAPEPYRRLRDAGVMRGDGWYWTADGGHLFIRRSALARTAELSERSLATPPAALHDGLVVTAGVLESAAPLAMVGFLVTVDWVLSVPLWFASPSGKPGPNQ